ncbi:MAG TPA: hypothetical protein VFZ29_11690 [Solirubrobacterales bacterium]
MKVKILGLAGLAMGIMALAVSSASATTMEWAGVTRNSSVGITANLEKSSFTVLSRTDTTPGNTCGSSTALGATSSPFTGTTVTAPLTELTFTSCNYAVTVDQSGQLYFQHISGTTNATVFSENAEVTVGTVWGFTVNCKTGTGTDIGKLTGVSSGEATLDIDAVLNCGFLLPSGVWKGTYRMWGNGLGVSA